MACKACEERRILIKLLVQAGEQWVKNGCRGEHAIEIYQRLRKEAIERGEVDGTQ